MPQSKNKWNLPCLWPVSYYQMAYHWLFTTVQCQESIIHVRSTHQSQHSFHHKTFFFHQSKCPKQGDLNHHSPLKISHKTTHFIGVCCCLTITLYWLKKMESDQSITITKATHFQLLQQLKSIQRMSQMHSCPYKQQETRHYVRALEEKYHWN